MTAIAAFGIAVLVSAATSGFWLVFAERRARRELALDAPCDPAVLEREGGYRVSAPPCDCESDPHACDIDLGHLGLRLTRLRVDWATGRAAFEGVYPERSKEKGTYRTVVYRRAFAGVVHGPRWSWASDRFANATDVRDRMELVWEVGSLGETQFDQLEKQSWLPTDEIVSLVASRLVKYAKLRVETDVARRAERFLKVRRS